MTNTIPNVPRELLDRCCKRMYDTMQGDLHEELRALLSTPSPAGVDGLEAVKVWEADADWDDYELVVRLSDAQAIIDGLRGEVACLAVQLDKSRKDNGAQLANRAAVIGQRDQQSQRIGELEGLLWDARYFCKPANLLKRIDAALSAVCAAAPNIAPTSEHKVPEGIVSITRSLGRAIVRFNTSEQLNEFYRAAKSALPTARSGQIRSTPR